MSTREILEEVSPASLQALQSQLSGKVLVMKFGATWCGPCKVIKPIVDAWVPKAPANIIYADIDIDESLDLYMALKKKHMISGVPTILAFHGDTRREHWFIPEDSHVGGDIKQCMLFLNRCTLKANALRT